MIKTYTSHEFVYDSHFSQENMSEYCCAISDNRSHSKVFLLEEKYRK